METNLALRPTGRMERFVIARNALIMFNTVNVSAIYTIPSSSVPRLALNPPTQEKLQALVFSCLKSVLRTQSMLGITIQNESSISPTYERLEWINLTQIVKVIEQDPEASRDIWIRGGLRERLDRVHELPVWRIIIAAKPFGLLTPATSDLKFALAFFGHYAIADGLSCAAFHAAFLEALNERMASGSSLDINNGHIIPVPQLPLVPNLEQRTKLPLTIWFAISALLKKFVYDPSDALAWSGPPVASEIPKTIPLVGIRSFVLPPVRVAALVQKCRQESTTVTGLLLVLVARHLAAMYPQYKHFVAELPCSLRKFTGHGPKDMGVFVSSCTTCFSSEDKPSRNWISCAPPGSAGDRTGIASDKQLWTSARAAKEHIRSKTMTSKNQVVAMLAFLSDYRSYFIGKLGRRREAAFRLTNITTIDRGLEQTRGKRAYFDRPLFCGSISTYDPPFVISVITVRGGEMTICLRWDEDVLDKEEAHAMAARLEKSLTECSRT